MESKYEKHPAYGMVGFSRVSGSGKRPLFGSSIDHHTTIRLTISEGCRKRDLSTHWYYASKQIVEVELSQTQFSDLLTTMNAGQGVPCTLLWRESVGDVERMQKHESDRKIVTTEFEETIQDGMSAATRLIEKAKEIAAKKNVTAKDREEYVRLAETIYRELAQNLPFVTKQFNESCDKLVKEAKGEFDACVSATVHNLGLDALKDKLGSIAPALAIEEAQP